MTRAQADEWMRHRSEYRIKAIFGNWVCWPTKKHPLVGNGHFIDFAYAGKYRVNNGFAYRDRDTGEIRTPNDLEVHPPKRMMEYLERNLPR